MVESRRKTSLLVIILLAVLGFFTFANSIATPLFLDAERLILDNPLLKNRDIGRLFTSSFFDRDWRTPLPVLLRYRPLTMLAFWIEHHLWNSSPAGYHLFNTALHIVNSCLLYHVARLLTNGPLLSFLIGAAFLIHPAHPPAVVYVTSLGDLLTGTGMLLLLLLHLGWRLHGSRLSAKRLAAEMLIYFSVLLSKESAVTAPLILYAYDVTFRRHGNSGSDQAALKSSRLKELAGLGFVFLAYYAIRTAWFPIGRIQPDEAASWLGRFGQSLSLYLRLLVFPVDFRFPFLMGSTAPRQSGSLLGLLLFAGGLWWFYRLRLLASPEERGMRFGLLWCFFALLPFLNFLYPLLLQPNYLYTPLMGFLLAIGIGGRHVVQRHLKSAGVRRMLFCGIVLFGFLTVSQTIRLNRYWGNPDQLFEGCLEPGSPYSSFGYNGLISFYRHQGNSSKALQIGWEAVRRDPQDADYYNMVGVICQDLGRLEEAKKMYRAALELNPFHPNARRNLAVVMPNGELSKAIQLCREAPPSGPIFVQTYLNLAKTYWKQGMDDDALRVLKRLIALEPKGPEPWLVYGDCLFSMRYFSQAINAYEAYLRLVPASGEGYSRLEEAYTAAGQMSQAAEAYRRRTQLLKSGRGARI